MRSETPAITRAINLAKVEPQELRAVRFIELPNRAPARLGYFFRPILPFIRHNQCKNQS